MLRSWRGTLLLVASLCLALVASLATASAKPRRITFGSNLAAKPARLAHPPFRHDTEFWNTTLPGGEGAGAPRAGTIVAIKVKTGSDSRSVPIRVSVIRRTGTDSVKVVTTSNPHWTLPAHSPGVHTFSTRGLRFKLPLKRGDLVALDTPGVKAHASVWFAAPVAGASTEVFSGRGPTQNQGASWRGKPHPGVELLLQVIEQP